MSNDIIILDRDVVASMVPSGARVVLQEGTEVVVTQSLGDSFTVNVFGNLARIDGKDAAVLGMKVKDPLEDLPIDSSVKDKVWYMLTQVFDPEIPVNIVDLGLVYQCVIEPIDAEKNKVTIVMTLTAPGCGMGPVIAEDAKQKVLAVPEVEEVEVEITFDPPWSQEMMSEAAKLELGFFE